jgi:uncharacterized protein YjbI with pentapeptide repeats
MAVFRGRPHVVALLALAAGLAFFGARSRMLEVLGASAQRSAGLAGARLAGAGLRLADLQGQSLTGCILTGVDFTMANLSFADLSGADLGSATLCRSTLAGARLAGANLQGANLKGACLQNADLREANLYGASYDQYTQWPERFDPVAAGAIEMRTSAKQRGGLEDVPHPEATLPEPERRRM